MEYIGNKRQKILDIQHYAKVLAKRPMRIFRSRLQDIEFLSKDTIEYGEHYFGIVLLLENTVRANREFTTMRRLLTYIDIYINIHTHKHPLLLLSISHSNDNNYGE